MRTSPSIRADTLAYILRQHADQLYEALTELLGADDDLDLEELNRDQEQELMLLVVSLVRSVAAESREMTPHLGAVASFGVENFAEITRYLEQRATAELQPVIDAKLREYLGVISDLGSPDSWNVDAALRRFAEMANASTDLRKRATAIGAQKLLRRQLADLRA